MGLYEKAEMQRKVLKHKNDLDFNEDIVYIWKKKRVRLKIILRKIGSEVQAKKRVEEKDFRIKISLIDVR